MLVKSRLQKIQVTELQFANDLALYVASRSAFESAGKSFAVGASQFGLTFQNQGYGYGGWY